MVHCIPLLSLQLNGTHDQDHVPWGKRAKCESNCPICKHASMMPMQLRKAINAANALLSEEVDYRSEDEQANNAITMTAINILGSFRL